MSLAVDWIICIKTIFKRGGSIRKGDGFGFMSGRCGMRVRTRQFFSNVPTDLLSEAKRGRDRMSNLYKHLKLWRIKRSSR